MIFSMIDTPRVRLKLVPGSVVVVEAERITGATARPASPLHFMDTCQTSHQSLIDTPRYALSVVCEFESPSVRVWCGFEICQTYR